MTGPLKDYTPQAGNVFVRTKEGTEFTVVSNRPPTAEMSDSLGRMRCRGKKPEDAAKQYRQVKHLPEDWPVVVKWTEGGQEVRKTLPVTDPKKA